MTGVTRLYSAIALLGVSMMTSGCVAIAVPIAAAGMIARDEVRDQDSDPAPTQIPAKSVADELATPAARAAMRAAEQRDAAPSAEAPPKPPTAPALGAEAMVSAAENRGVTILEGGSLPIDKLPAPSAGGAEAAAQGLQGYQSLWTHVSTQMAKFKRGEPLQSVVLARDAKLDAPAFVPCDRKPPAVIFDLDESAEGGDPEARWRRWRGDVSDNLVVVPGTIEGVDAARREGATVIFMTARPTSSADAVAATIEHHGLGKVRPGETLYLRGDMASPDASDPVRVAIATRYCVIAIVGDVLGDFSDQFNASGDAARRRAMATETMIGSLWGAGWFLLPNPLRSTMQPAGKR